MAWLIAITLAVHVLSSVFWAGSTFTMARLAGLGGARLVVPQAGAAAVAILTGAYLGNALHGGNFGAFEQVLMIGIVADRASSSTVACEKVRAASASTY